MVLQKMIGTLTFSSWSKIIFEDFSRGISGSGTEIFCLVPRKTFNVQLLRFHSAQTRIAKPLRLSFSFNASQVDSSAAETQTQEKYPTKTVHVRFQLQKECEFGEDFFILGDDPAFGFWDPENAIPLNWSDGHVWTVDLDMPVGKLIEFKFILKEKTGNILWQPGRNRVLETWETNNSITICEDWENADLQRIFEEGLVPVNQGGLESSVVNSDMPIVVENVSSTLPKEKIELNRNHPSIAEKEALVPGTVIQENRAKIFSENVGYIKDGSKASLVFDVQDEKKVENTNESVAILHENGTEVAMVTGEESSALVLGLTPLSALEKEDMTDRGDKETSTTYASLEVVKEGATENSPELDTKQETEEEREREGEATEVAVLEKGEGQEVNGVEQKHYRAAEEERVETEPLERHVIEKDIQWGRRTLRKLLNSFGFL